MKWRFFNHLLGGDDPDAERVYLWHIQKRRGSGYVDGEKGINDYVPAARALAESMTAKGFDIWHPVPLDRDGELLGGAHRTACALALGVGVAIQRINMTAWAPAWDRAWFVERGMAGDDLARLDKDWACLSG